MRVIFGAASSYKTVRRFRAAKSLHVALRMTICIAGPQ